MPEESLNGEPVGWHPAAQFIPVGKGWNAAQLRAVADHLERENEVAFLGTIQTYKKGAGQ